MNRPIFYVSDSTAMTAKGLGQSLLSQFDNVVLVEKLRPYVDSEAKILHLVAELKEFQARYQSTPIVFASIMDPELMHLLSSQIEGVIDILHPFMNTLEAMMSEKSSRAVGRAHKTGEDSYKKRIEAIDFTLATDDGLRTNDYDQADMILLGVSRTGKTPTALYLTLNFGFRVANFPFTSEDLPEFSLSKAHERNRHKLVGLMISPERLFSIRKERRAEGQYANPEQIKAELLALRTLFERERIPFIDATTRSVEEIAASVMNILFGK